jgi:antitoxin ParD1/3/4
MALTTMEISLPEPLKEYVDSCVEHGGFGTPSGYLRALIRNDKERRMATLENELLDALDSGGAEFSFDELTAENLIESLEAKRSTSPDRCP